MNTEAISEPAEINTGAVVLEEPSPEPLDAQTETFENNTLSAATPEEPVSAAQLNTDTSVTTMTTTAATEGEESTSSSVTAESGETSTTPTMDAGTESTTDGPDLSDGGMPTADDTSVDTGTLPDDTMADSGLGAQTCVTTTGTEVCTSLGADGSKVVTTKTTHHAPLSGGRILYIVSQVKEFINAAGTLTGREKQEHHREEDATHFTLSDYMLFERATYDQAGALFEETSTMVQEVYEKALDGTSRTTKKEFVDSHTLAGVVTVSQGTVLYTDPSLPDTATEILDANGNLVFVDGTIVTQIDVALVLMRYDALRTYLNSLIFPAI